MTLTKQFAYSPLHLFLRSSTIYYERGIAKKDTYLRPEGVFIQISGESYDLEDAIRDFDEAIRQFSDYANAYYERGKIKEYLDDTEGYKQDLQLASRAAFVTHQYEFCDQINEELAEVEKNDHSDESLDES